MPLHKELKDCFTSADGSFSDFKLEKESKEYSACTFQLNAFQIYFRKAKITPKKQGQFVTFYKRIPSGSIAPFDEEDAFQFLIVKVDFKEQSGYFIFPKPLLLQKNILSTSVKEGKRAFRIYAPWDAPNNKQALQTQRWQFNYFTAAANLKKYLLEGNLT